MMIKAFVLFLLLISTSTELQASEQAVIVRSGALFDSESGAIVKGMDVEVQGSRILRVGKNLQNPKAKVIDLSSYTIMPGLIDAHTHLLILQTLDEPFEVTMNRYIRLGPSRRLEASKPIAAAYLNAGFTTVRDLGNSGPYGDVLMRKLVRNGTIAGPKIIASGPGISPVGGQFPEGTAEEWVIREEYEVITTPAEGIAAVERVIKNQADVIKIFSDGIPGPGFLSVETMKAIVKTAHDGGVKVAAHAVLDKSIGTAIEAGVDSIEHGYQISDENLRLMAKKGIFFVATDTSLKLAKIWTRFEHPDWSDEQVAEAARQWQRHSSNRLQKAMKYGVKLAMGSDMYIDFSKYGLSQGEAAKELLYAYVEEGMSPSASLQTATLNAAELLGYQGRLGVLKAGAAADIIAVQGDPTQDISAVSKVAFIMQDGKIIKQPNDH